jgi:predicted RNA binding protein YcfA (HicA-like mRNA interferase family)
MKQIEVIKIITKNGAVFIRHGGDHDWYRNPKTGVSEAIPRHREIKEYLAKKIIKNLS